MGVNVRTIAVLGAGKIGSAIIKAISECWSGVRVIATGRRDITLENC